MIHRFRSRAGFTGCKERVNGVGNVLRYDDAVLTDVAFNVDGNGNEVSIAPGCHLSGVTFQISGDDHRVVIEPGCRIGAGSILWFEDRGGRLTIGEGSTFEQVHLAVVEPGASLTVGRDCMVAYDVDVRTSDSHSIVSLESGQRVNRAEDVVIGDHVWIGAHAVLLKGVRIPAQSVVATGAVVTRKFHEPGVVIAGNPADVVKTQITWTRERT